MKIFRLFVAFTLVCFALSQRAQGVLPPPPGGYPNFTTAAGDHALQALTLGVGNTAIGTFSLFSVTTGNFNTAVGAGALDLNLGDSNTATGAAALLFNTTGSLNTAVGTAALEFNETGAGNTANGAFALFSNTTGSANTANGFQVLFQNATGDNNTANGGSALVSNTTGNNNTANGGSALVSNTTGNNNTAIGTNALLGNTGSGNIALGADAGSFLTTGNNNIDIGNPGIIDEAETIRIGGSQTKTFIAGIRGVTISTTLPVLIDPFGQLGTMSSSRRFKKEIKPMESASEAILALKPVTFHYKNDKTDTPQFGLIAEEVADVNPDLVVCDEKGEIYSVRYDAVNAMLLNEFLREHRKNEDQQAAIERQQKQIDALTAGLRKVSARRELSKPAPQTVNNP